MEKPNKWNGVDHERLDQGDHVDEVLKEDPVEICAAFFAIGITEGGPRRRRGRRGARVLCGPLPRRSSASTRSDRRHCCSAELGGGREIGHVLFTAMWILKLEGSDSKGEGRAGAKYLLPWIATQHHYLSHYWTLRRTHLRLWSGAYQNASGCLSNETPVRMSIDARQEPGFKFKKGDDWLSSRGRQHGVQ